MKIDDLLKNSQKPAGTQAAQETKTGLSRQDLILLIGNQISALDMQKGQTLDRNYLLSLIRDVAQAVDGK